MKKLLLILLLPHVLLCFVQSQIPFSRGVNLTQWFQVSGPKQIQFTRFTRQDFINIKSLGCDVIRLPINLHYMTSGEPDFIPDPLFLGFLDSVVNWADELNIHLLIDNHTFDPAINTDPMVEYTLIKVWTNMASHYKDQSHYIYYEILNEPHGISDVEWGTIQQHVIDAIRAVDSTHTIIVGPANWNGYDHLSYLPDYSDEKLIYTFHFYEPFLFTHQGAGWTDPPMTPLSGVPFPYQAGNMPVFPSELNSTWIQSAFNNYYSDGTAQHVRDLLDYAVDFKYTRNVPVFCGEMGVYIPNSPRQDRINWYDTVRTYIADTGIAWTMWDYTGEFGIFNQGGNDLFNYDLDTALARALGFNVPPQYTFYVVTDTLGFPVYSDYIEEKITESDNPANGTIDFYDQQHPNNGNYCIRWTGSDQYGFLGFDFKPDKDLSYLQAHNFALDFMVRGDTHGKQFDVRFLDTKTGEPDDHPWRIRYTVNESIAEWDRKWHHVYLPLDEFTEQGSFDGQWFSPVGEYDWSAVDRFEIVTEYYDLDGVTFWFDNIHITDMDTAMVRDTSRLAIITGINITSVGKITLVPNPAGNSVLVQYDADEYPAVIELYSVFGMPVFRENLVERKQCLDISYLTKGVYFYTIYAGRKTVASGKLLKM